MTLDEAKTILGAAVQNDGLNQVAPYISWSKDFPDDIGLDGNFSLSMLEAIVVYAKGQDD